MYQSLRLSRPWLALVLIAFCLPLFVGLGNADLETDEAIYSFAVDRILEVGDWLEPKSSPDETAIFLEKPPLKFWMVAAPIQAGLLPHNEFGLRFIDAVAGGAAFVYVFAIGSLLAGPVCGVVAVLLLFVHWPLVFAHGLRTNNMEASLLLSYCGGVFHFLRWSRLDDERRRRHHVLWAALFFVLGFMTKFVAVLFLPFTLGLAALAAPRVRARLVQDWRTWLAAAALVLALCAPWFLYAQARFGSVLWETILGEHVLRRMTTFLDPTHVHPWYWYLQQLWHEFVNQGMQWLMVAGLLVLLVQTIRRRWFEGVVVLLWAVLPLAIISAGTSKLYHYVYPFLPPLTLAAGYLVSLVVMLAPAPLRRVLDAIDDVYGRLASRVAARASQDTVRTVVSWLVVSAGAVAIASIILGGVRFQVGGITLFRSSGVVRPIVVILLLTLATSTSARVGQLVVALLVFNTLPLAAYRGQLEQLHGGKHPMRTAAECVMHVQDGQGAKAGILMDVPEGIWHPLYYYFRRVRPVTLAAIPLDPAIDRSLNDPTSPRPVLIGDSTWRAYLAERTRIAGATGATASPPMVPFLNTLLLLPGPYAVCSSEAVLTAPR